MIHAVNLHENIQRPGDIKATAVEGRLRNEGVTGFDKVLKGTMEHETRETETAARGRKKPLDRKLWDVCVEAESLFVAKMLKEMRKTVHKNDFLHGGFAEEIFEDMLYDEYALRLSKNTSLGMAKMLYDELSRRV